MNAGLVALCTLALCVCAAALIRIRLERNKQREAVRGIRLTELYGHLYPLLIRCDRRYVESVAVREEEIAIRMYRPAGRCLRYTFDKHGFDDLEPAALFALAQAVMVDMKSLRDGEHYEFITHRYLKPNGERACWYEYIIRNAYKTEIQRAIYCRRDGE